MREPVTLASRSWSTTDRGAGGNIGADLVARAEPDGYTLLMSSAGVLTINQFLYRKMPFDPARAVIGGQIQWVMDNPPTVLQHIRAGTLRAVAVASPQRLAQLPDVPTFDAAGLNPDYSRS